jgi:hypothetical protein
LHIASAIGAIGLHGTVTMKNHIPPSIQFDKVADIYDDYVRVDFDLPFWLQEARSVTGRVLELTSGTGRVSLPLLIAGIDLTCVDCSREMLSVLRRKLRDNHLSCPVHEMDMADLSLRYHYDLIFIPFHSFSETLERSQQKQTLQRIHSHLMSQGHFICTLQNRDVLAGSLAGKMALIGEFPLGTGGFLTVRSQVRYDGSTHIGTGRQFYELCDTKKTLISTRSLDISFYLFDRIEFEQLASRAGFEVVALYGDYAYGAFDEGCSPFMIWKLKKATHSA